MDYQEYVKIQVESITETLTEVMLGDFSVVAWTSEPDETFGYLCAMVNVAINAARNGRKELQDRIKQLETEITERQKAQKALIESKSRIRHIIESALDAVVEIDGSGLIRVWNSQAENVFGWKSVEVNGRSFAETVIAETDRSAQHAGFKRFLATGENAIINQRIEVTALHHDSHEFPMELVISPAKQGGEWTFSAFIRDMTLRNQQEEERIRLENLYRQSQNIAAVFDENGAGEDCAVIDPVNVSVLEPMNCSPETEENDSPGSAGLITSSTCIGADIGVGVDDTVDYY